jgi:hypothetical protein
MALERLVPKRRLVESLLCKTGPSGVRLPNDLWVAEQGSLPGCESKQWHHPPSLPNFLDLSPFPS